MAAPLDWGDFHKLLMRLYIMTCFKPLQAVRLDVSENPIRVISSVQALQLRGSTNLLQLPCGRCVGCRLAYSRNWAVRCVHESSLFENNSFITLTYNDEFNYRNGGSLNYLDFTLFMKRTRIALDRQSKGLHFLTDGSPMRFYMCGEYGDRTFRPHFHALLFNLDFADKELFTVRNGFRLYTSETLSKLWSEPYSKRSFGNVLIGSITLQSCGYVSRYCVKKALNGDRLVYFNRDTGEFLSPEKTNMSRRPGIAYEWFRRYSSDVYPDDKIVMPNGMICKPPRYYDLQLEKIDSVSFETVKQSRLEFASSPQSIANSTTERLIVRETIQLKKLELLPRHL